MSSKPMSFKAKINNYAKSRHLPAQIVMQNVMFERLLDRLSRSEYRDKFVIKGGLLVSVIVGLDTRVTMDIDTTLRNASLTEEYLSEIVKEICDIELDDDTFFHITGVELIRKDDIYGGYRVKLEALFEKIVTPLSIDVSTGDVITPGAEKYNITGIMEEKNIITLWGYNVETILAEKAETILSRGILNTRPRDFYDVYILVKQEKYDPAVFHEALRVTAEHRRSWDMIQDHNSVLDNILKNDTLRGLWEKYRKQFYYAKDITFEDTVGAVRMLLEKKE